MCFSLFIFSVVLLPIFLLTYRIKNSFLRWCLIIIPPLFLIFLYWIPCDIWTMPFWAPAGFAFFWSVISLLINVVIIIVRRLRKRPQIIFNKTRFVRPILTICIFLIVFSFVQQSRFSANKYAMEVGKEIQSIADTNGICPEKIQGWVVSERDPNMYGNMYGKYGTKYPVKYLPSENRKEFTISVYNNIDEHFYVTGGVELELRATHSGPGGSKEVPIE